MQSEISNWHFAKGPFYNLAANFGGVAINSDMGCYLGAPHASCTNPIVVTNNGRSANASGSTRQEDLSAIQEQNAIYLIGASLSEPVQYAIFDEAGRKIAEGTAHESRQRLTDTYALPPGIYLIQTSSGTGKQQVLKLAL